MEVTVAQRKEQCLFGVWCESCDRHISKDIERLSARYREALGSPTSLPLPFFVLTSGYDELTAAASLFVGGLLSFEGAEEALVPAGTYATVTVRPLLGMLWGPVIGKAKRDFYRSWLPKNNLHAANLEFELHTERSVGQTPTIDLCFALSPQ